MNRFMLTARSLVLRRARSNWLTLSAAFLTTLLATTLLAAAPIYAAAVADAGLQRTLQDAPISADIQITANLRGSQFSAADARVQQSLAPLLSLSGGSGTRTGTSVSFALPGQPANSDIIRLATFAFFDRLSDHATLVDGSWPVTSSAPYSVALPLAAARALGYQVGQTLTLTDRQDAGHQVPLRISGIYRVDDPHDPFWFADPLATEGSVSSESFITYGPFVVTPDVFLGPITAEPSTISWRLFPDFGRLAVGDVPRLRDAVLNLPGTLNAGQSSGTDTVTSQLGQILDQSTRSLLVTRTAILLLAIQLMMLAIYALVLTGELLNEQRVDEIALLRARGMSPRQEFELTMLEGLLLVVPPVVVGPWLAAGSLRLLSMVGPLATIGLHLRSVVDPTAVLLSGLGGLVCLGALLRPLLRQRRSRRRRPGRRSVAQRAGLDLALLLVAALGFWQLRRYGAPLTRTVQGRLGIDPLLVATPGLGLLAGAVLALRLIPLLAQLADRMAARRQAAVFALGVWQLARRPLRYARASLLLILALAIGLFAMGYDRTWTQSQRDQAAFQAGADIRLTPNSRPDTGIPELDLAGAEQTLPGVGAVLPVSRQFASLPDSRQVATLLLLDSVRAAPVVQFRPDLASVPFATLMQRLAAGRPALATMRLPGAPERIRLSAQAHLSGDTQPGDVFLQISAVVRDASGTLDPVDLGQLAPDGTTHTLSANLVDALSNGQLARPDAPLDLVELELRASSQSGASATLALSLSQLAVSGDPTGESWVSVPLIGALPGAAASPGFVAAVNRATVIPGRVPTGVAPQAASIHVASSSVDDLSTTIALESGSISPVTYTLRPAGSVLPTAIPVLVDHQLLAATDSTIGSSFPLQLGGGAVNARIVGIVESFPTADPSRGPVIVADLGTVSDVELLARGSDPPVPTEHWLAVDPRRSDAVAAALQVPPYSSPTLVSRTALERSLLSDPLAVGTLGALLLGFVAAVVFAGIGFAVSAAVSARERVSEFAMLRALGLSARQLTGWLSVEQGLLVGISLVGGTVVGLVLSWLTLPLITVTQQASGVVPRLIVVIPWLGLVELEGIVLGVVAVVVALVAVVLRRLGIGSVLRAGTE